MLRHAIGLGLLGIGIFLVHIGRQSAQNLIFLLMGFSFFLYAAVVLARSKNRVVSVVATAVVVVILAVLTLGTLAG